MDELRKGNLIILMECCQMVIYNQIGLAEIMYLVCGQTIAQVRGLLGSLPFLYVSHAARSRPGILLDLFTFILQSICHFKKKS